MSIYKYLYIGLIIDSIMHTLHCFRLSMRINRELRLYLGTEVSETLLPQHGSSHMGQCSQPSWHLLNNTPAKDIYLLQQIVLPPSSANKSLMLSYTSKTIFTLMVLFFCFNTTITVKAGYSLVTLFFQASLTHFHQL